MKAAIKYQTQDDFIYMQSKKKGQNKHCLGLDAYMVKCLKSQGMITPKDNGYLYSKGWEGELT